MDIVLENKDRNRSNQSQTHKLYMAHPIIRATTTETIFFFTKKSTSLHRLSPFHRGSTIFSLKADSTFSQSRKTLNLQTLD